MGGEERRKRKLKRDIEFADDLRNQMQNNTPQLNHYIEQKEEKLDDLNEE